MLIINGLTPTTILSALLACATQGDHATRVETSSPSDIQSQVESGEDQHFCCDDVDLSTWSGEGCLLISEDDLNSCSNILYCDGKWERQDGRAACAQTLTDKQDPDVEVEDQHFCCQSVDLDKWSGEDCTTIPAELINSCAEVLYCGGNWGKSGNKVKCA